MNPSTSGFEPWVRCINSMLTRARATMARGDLKTMVHRRTDDSTDDKSQSFVAELWVWASLRDRSDALAGFGWCLRGGTFRPSGWSGSWPISIIPPPPVQPPALRWAIPKAPFGCATALVIGEHLPSARL